MDTSAYQAFAKNTLKTEFKDIELLMTAFTHRSYLNEHKKTVKEHNERLEFLGRRRAGAGGYRISCTATMTTPEGILTNWRSSLVRTESIGAAAAKFGFEPLLRLSRGEKRGPNGPGPRSWPTAFEAVVGALYLDQGYEAAKRFITESILSTFEEILSSGSWMDPKSHLQELAQSQETATPVYKVMNEDGPDHDKTLHRRRLCQ